MMSTIRSLAYRTGIMAALVIGLAAEAQAQSPLRWKFQAGQTLNYEFSQKNQIKVKTPDKEFASKNDLIVNVAWKVKNVTPDGTAEIAMEIKRVQADVEAGQEKLKYDSQAEKQGEGPAKQFHDVYSVAIGPEFTLKIDARGQVLEAKVPEKVTAALQASPFLAVADGGSFLSEKGLKNVFAQVVPVLPEKPVSKGDTWSGTIELPVQPLKLTLTHKNTLAELDDTTAKITTVLETSIKPEADSPLVVEMKKQEGAGTVSVDTKTGRITASSFIQTINLGLSFMDKKIDQTVSINAQLKLLP